jgi:hypothetical protein
MSPERTCCMASLSVMRALWAVAVTAPWPAPPPGHRLDVWGQDRFTAGGIDFHPLRDSLHMRLREGAGEKVGGLLHRSA